MAPSKKPLFDPPPPTTLDHFFAKPKASSSQSASSRVQKRVKTRHLSSQTRKRTDSNRVQPSGAEIIVLDSDDDDDAPADGAKRMVGEQTGDSSDIEVVEAVSEGSHDVPRSRKKAKVESAPNCGTNDLLAFAQDDALHFSEFGKPQLLVHTEENDMPPLIEDRGFQPAGSGYGDDPCPMAAPATHFAVPDDSHCYLSETQCDSSGVVQSCSTQVDSCDVIEIEDEWGTGDDELVRTNGAEVDGVLEINDDDEVEECLKLKDEPASTSGDISDQCPFCGITLTSFSSPVCFLLSFTPHFLMGFVSGHAITYYYLLRLVLHH